jgi:acyl-CoA thioesterase-1
VDIVQHHERAAGMKRGGHTPSEPGRAAGRQNLRPYGAITRAFNAVRDHGFHSPLRGGGLVLAAVVLGLMSFASPVMARVPVILDFGDSLTAGYGVPAGQAFPARLEAWLHERGIAARVVNAGVSGDTTAGGVARLDWALADKPDLVILALGANDALRGIEPSTVRDNLDKMIGRIEATGAKVLLLGMLAPPNWGEEYKRAFDQIFPELAHLHHLPLYPFFLEGVAMNPELNQPDGLHPNEKGVAVLVDRIAPVVAELIGGAS